MRGDRIRELREKLDLSQGELAALVGKGEAQIWRYEHGAAEPRANVLLRLARFFNVSADYLLGNSDNPNLAPEESGLSIQEEAIITALRRGQRLKAVQIIVADRFPL